MTTPSPVKCALFGLLLASSGCATHRTPPSEVRERDGEGHCISTRLLSMKPASSFAVGPCVKVDPSLFDLRRDVLPPESCAGRGFVVRELRRSNRLDSDIGLSSNDGAQRSIAFGSYSTFDVQNMGLSAPLACDEQVSRFYFGNAVLGELAAYSADGRELWRHVLPRFVSLEAEKDLSRTDIQLIRAAFKSHGGRFVRILSSGPYVLAQFSMGENSLTQVVYHRSGTLVGVIGPWDGCAIGTVSPNGFRFAANGVASFGRFDAPTEQLNIYIRNDRTDSLVQHFLAWCLPTKPHSQPAWTICSGLEASAIQFRLGTLYDREHSEIGKQVHDSLGFEFANQMLSRPHFAARVAGDPFSESWDRDLLAALLDDGADCDFAREAARRGIVQDHERD